MPNAETLASLGVYVRRGFLDPELCATLRSAAFAAPRVASVVTHEDGETLVDEVRRSVKAEVAPSTSELVESRFVALMPEMERHFAVSLHGWQPLQFLIYQEGDMFGPHRDRDSGESGRHVILDERKITTVIFLNGQADSGEDSFSGGYLTLYGLVDEAPSMPVPVIAEPGLLVAFRSETIHSVSKITRGVRFSVAGWFS